MTTSGAAVARATAVTFHAPREMTTDVLATCGRFEITREGISVNGLASYDDWERAVRFTYDMREAATWALADLFAYGEAHYGEEYAQVLDEYEFSDGYLNNLQTLYRNFPPERRRRWLRYRLGVSFFQAVCPLKSEVQVMMLDQACGLVDGERLTRDALRQLVADLPDEDRKHPKRQRKQTVQIVTLPAATGANGHNLPAVAVGHNVLPTANGNGRAMITSVAPVLDFHAVEDFDTSVFVSHNRAGDDDEYAPYPTPAVQRTFSVKVLAANDDGSYLVKSISAGLVLAVGEIVDLMR